MINYSWGNQEGVEHLAEALALADLLLGEGAVDRLLRREAGLDPSTRDEDNIPRALLGWAAGCATIWSGLFLIGSMLYGRWPQAGALAVVCLTMPACHSGSGTAAIASLANSRWRRRTASKAPRKGRASKLRRSVQ